MAGAPAPRADGSHEIKAWRDFIANRGLGVGSMRMSPDREAALARRCYLQAERLAFELKRVRGEFVPRAEVLAGWLCAMQEFRQIVENAIIPSLPKSLHGRVRAALARAFEKIRAKGREFERAEPSTD